MVVDPHFSRASPLDRQDYLLFLKKIKKIVFGKSLSRHLFYLFLKGKIKQERKPQRSDSIVLKKHVFEKPESRSGDQVTYWEGTYKR